MAVDDRVAGLRHGDLRQQRAGLPGRQGEDDPVARAELDPALAEVETAGAAILAEDRAQPVLKATVAPAAASRSSAGSIRLAARLVRAISGRQPAPLRRSSLQRRPQQAGGALLGRGVEHRARERRPEAAHRAGRPGRGNPRPSAPARRAPAARRRGRREGACPGRGAPAAGARAGSGPGSGARPSARRSRDRGRESGARAGRSGRPRRRSPRGSGACKGCRSAADDCHCRYDPAEAAVEVGAAAAARLLGAS